MRQAGHSLRRRLHRFSFPNISGLPRLFGAPLCCLLTSTESTGVEEESAEASQAVDNFSWKDVLKAVSRLQRDGKLTEGD